MKKVKTLKRYCKFCKKHTQQKLVIVKTGQKRGSLKRGSISRARKRGLGRGMGNRGRWGSKPTKPKMIGAKSSKKTNIMYTCSVCKKSTLQRKGIRTKKLELI